MLHNLYSVLVIYDLYWCANEFLWNPYRIIRVFYVTIPFRTLKNVFLQYFIVKVSNTKICLCFGYRLWGASSPCGMDCRGDELIQHNNRASAQAVPFQYLINEQAKSILALQVRVNYYVNYLNIHIRNIA